MGVEAGPEPPFTFDLGRGPVVLAAHQARLTGRETPNSLLSVAACAASGAARVELDVTFTADGEPVISHERELRVGGRRVPADEVDSKDVPAVPRLWEAVQLLRPTAAVLQVDLKLFRPIRAQEVERLAAVVAPLQPRVIVGSQAHWNLRPLARAGLTVGFDPTLHFRYVPPGAPKAWARGLPRKTGVWGFRDDSPLAQEFAASASSYFAARFEDILGLVPQVSELMVDYGTVLRLGELGFALGPALRDRGVALAAWTVRSYEGGTTLHLVHRLAELGVSTVITDVPLLLGQALRGEGSVLVRELRYQGATATSPSLLG